MLPKHRVTLSKVVIQPMTKTLTSVSGSKRIYFIYFLQGQQRGLRVESRRNGPTLSSTNDPTSCGENRGWFDGGWGCSGRQLSDHSASFWISFFARWMRPHR